MIDPMDDVQTSKINEEANSPTMHGDHGRAQDINNGYSEPEKNIRKSLAFSLD
jgi:hypothetical protein